MDDLDKAKAVNDQANNTLMAVDKQDQRSYLSRHVIFAKCLTRPDTV